MLSYYVGNLSLFQVLKGLASFLTVFPIIALPTIYLLFPLLKAHLKYLLPETFFDLFPVHFRHTLWVGTSFLDSHNFLLFKIRTSEFQNGRNHVLFSSLPTTFTRPSTFKCLVQEWLRILCFKFPQWGGMNLPTKMWSPPLQFHTPSPTQIPTYTGYTKEINGL
jgi:hypothetical protein